MKLQSAGFVVPLVAAVILPLAAARVAAQARATAPAGPTGARAWLLEKDGDLAGVGNFKSTSGCPGDSKGLQSCARQKAKQFKPPRTPDGRPNFQGIWGRTLSAGSTAFEKRTVAGPTTPVGQGMVVDPPDGLIPYQPWARAKRAEIIETYLDQTANCLPPGVPRHSVGPGPYQILQGPNSVSIITERPGHARIIPTDGRPHISSKVRLWQGDSVGRWEGDTLVIDTTNANGLALMNVDYRDFASPDLHVVERITMIDLDQLYYEVTLTDPSVYTRPWTMAWGRTRWPGKGMEAFEDACVEGNRSNKLSVPNLMFLGLPELAKPGR